MSEETEIKTKICKGCQIEKEVSSFSVAKRVSGFSYLARCKSCINETAKNYSLSKKVLYPELEVKSLDICIKGEEVEKICKRCEMSFITVKNTLYPNGCNVCQNCSGGGVKIAHEKRKEKFKKEVEEGKYKGQKKKCMDCHQEKDAELIDRGIIGYRNRCL